MKNIKNLIEAIGLIDPEVLKADNTPAAINIDGVDGVGVYVYIGEGGITFDSTNKIEFKLTASDDDDSYTAVADADVIGCTVGTGGIIKSLVAAHATPTMSEFSYIGPGKYLKLLADFSGTHGTGTAIAAFVVKTDPHISF